MPRLSPFLILTILMAAAFGPAGRLVAAEQPPVDFLELVDTREAFESISVPSSLGRDVVRIGKFLLPAVDGAGLLPPLLQNVQRHELHLDFLRAVFPEQFPALDMSAYLALVERREGRRYFAGILSEIDAATGPVFEFSLLVRDPSAHPEELLAVDEVRAVYERLASVFLLRPLAYAPTDPASIEAARSWSDPGFPVRLAGTGDYAGYTRAVGYGRLRVLSEDQLAEAGSRGRITWQDIVVLDRAPSDIEGVVAGVITAEPQSELGHLAIRTARRGTPNAFVRNAAEALGPLNGRLVRLDVRLLDYAVEEATPAEAEAWWAASRPGLSREPTLDEEYFALDSLDVMDLSEEESFPEARYGGKASNLARLQRVLDGPWAAYRSEGFAVPVRYYLDFMRRNTLRSAVRPDRRVTYQEYLEELVSWEPFLSDGEVRFASLERLREEMESDGEVDVGLIYEIIGKTVEVFGSTEVALRFRSSSNVEDALEFNGAGLYESTKGCAADDLDGDLVGPSLCDPAESEERTIARALRKVWASLWSFRAHEERSYYGIDPMRAGMAVLVTRAFLDERASGVAFTGNPSNLLDPRYTVTAQAGDSSVVSPKPGEVTELDRLEVRDGEVTSIDRVRRSSLAPPGELILSDAILREFGALLDHMERRFPVDLQGHDAARVLLDVEFKVDRNGALGVKQVRPFLAAEPPPAGPTFELSIPEGLGACSRGREGGTTREAYEQRSQVRFRGGIHELPTGPPVFEGSIVAELSVGEERELAVPGGPGRFAWSARSSSERRVIYAFEYHQSFRRADGMRLELRLGPIETEWRGDDLDRRRVLEPRDLDFDVRMTVFSEDPSFGEVPFGACDSTHLPAWSILVEVEGGDRVELSERFQAVTTGSGPARVDSARVVLGGARQDVADRWRLVYSSLRHNRERRYLIALDPPLSSPLAPSPVHFVEVAEPNLLVLDPAVVAYLGRDFEVLSRPAVACYARAPAGGPLGCRFRRGDADSSGGVNITDAIFTLHHLFGGGEEPSCMDAADFDDSGAIDILDVQQTLIFLFRGRNLAAPPGPFQCGPDPSPEDPYTICRDPSC